MADDVFVEFAADVQSLAALHAAAYRLIGMATCEIDKRDGRYICRLIAQVSQKNASPIEPDVLRARFLDLVCDENLRERLATKTEPVRNLILSLAFASLASQAPHQS